MKLTSNLYKNYQFNNFTPGYRELVIRYQRNQYIRTNSIQVKSSFFSFFSLILLDGNVLICIFKDKEIEFVFAYSTFLSTPILFVL